MKTSTILLLLLIAIITTNSKCKKEAAPKPDNPYGLPNATQTGANMFAYLNNGVPQIAKNSIYTMGGEVINDTLFVDGESGGANYFEYMGIGIKGNLKEIFLYQVDNIASNSRIIGFQTNKTCMTGGNVVTVYSTNGTIMLTKLDKINKIISGTFFCKIPIPNCDTLYITEGRFDIKYY